MTDKQWTDVFILRQGEDGEEIFQEVELFTDNFTVCGLVPSENCRIKIRRRIGDTDPGEWNIFKHTVKEGSRINVAVTPMQEITIT